MREIYLKLTVDWEDYEDIADEIVVEDAFEFYTPKDGTKLEIIRSEYDTVH
jgi:hypothetical protein